MVGGFSSNHAVRSGTNKQLCCRCPIVVSIGNSMICSDIFGMNTTSDISRLLYVISRAVRRVKCETILKYHMWYLIIIIKVFIRGFKQTLKLTSSIIKWRYNFLSLNYNRFRIKETSIYKAFLKPLCIHTWNLVRMRPTA